MHVRCTVVFPDGVKGDRSEVMEFAAAPDKGDVVTARGKDFMVDRRSHGPCKAGDIISQPSLTIYLK